MSVNVIHGDVNDDDNEEEEELGEMGIFIVISWIDKCMDG